MNSVIPKSGDAVEWVTTKTGIKERWERHLERKEQRAVLDQHFAGWRDQDPAIVKKWIDAWEIT